MAGRDCKGANHMTAKIASSRRKLDSWAAVRELDRMALPMLAEHGIQQAYQMAADAIWVSGDNEQTLAPVASAGLSDQPIPAHPPDPLSASMPVCF
jgi:hypothetical protein